MGQSRQKKFDRISNGFAWGILLPLAIFLGIYLIRYHSVPFSQFIENLSEMKILIKLLSLCGFSNLLIFYLLYRNQMDKAAKGVIAATFVYGFLVLLSRLL
jgi:hypothetical protein